VLRPAPNQQNYWDIQIQKGINLTFIVETESIHLMLEIKRPTKPKKKHISQKSSSKRFLQNNASNITAKTKGKMVI